jgi:hypothetical protein
MSKHSEKLDAVMKDAVVLYGTGGGGERCTRASRISKGKVRSESYCIRWIRNDSIG